MLILALLLGLAAFVCQIIIAIEAFRDEIWKGILCIVCCFYFYYYAFVEYDSDKKWLVVGLAVFGQVAAVALLKQAGLGAGGQAIGTPVSP